MGLKGMEKRHANRTAKGGENTAQPSYKIKPNRGGGKIRKDTKKRRTDRVEEERRRWRRKKGIRGKTRAYRAQFKSKRKGHPN